MWIVHQKTEVIIYCYNLVITTMNSICLSCGLVTTILLTLIGITYIEEEFNDVGTFFTNMFSPKNSVQVGCLVTSLVYMQYIFLIRNRIH